MIVLLSTPLTILALGVRRPAAVFCKEAPKGSKASLEISLRGSRAHSPQGGVLGGTRELYQRY